VPGVADDRDLLGDPGGRLDQRQDHAGLDVGAVGRGAPAAAARHPEDVAEDVREGREDVAHVAEAAAHAGVGAGVAEAIVAGPLLRLAEDLVGLGGLLELVLGLGVAWISIRVQLHGQPAVGALELAGVDVARDTQHFVVIPFFGHEQPL
jgi:hypothetical protein